MARRSFFSNRDANVGIILALAIVPLVGIAGLAMDYARALNEQARVQTMTDSTALAMAHRSPTLTKAQLTTEAKAFFHAGMPDFVPRGEEWLDIDRNNERLNLRVESGIETVLLKVLNIKTMDIAVSSQIAWGLSKVEIALVLDTTGSMAQQGKMTALKTAAANFVDILEGVNRNGSVKIGLVPYDVQVRVDPATFRNAAWLDFSSDRVYPIGSPRATPRLQAETDRSKWNGCISDRPSPKDTSDDFIVAHRQNSPRWSPAMKCAANGTPNANWSIRPLSENFSALRSQISNLKSNGATNIPLGMAWGMSLLSGNGPFAGAAAQTDNLEKVIVLLTDGDNTRDAFGGDGQLHYAAGDERLRTLCAEARTRKYTVYSILVIDGNAKLLEECAMKRGAPAPGNFHNVAQASELIPVFQRIANELSDLRISK